MKINIFQKKILFLLGVLFLSVANYGQTPDPYQKGKQGEVLISIRADNWPMDYAITPWNYDTNTAGSNGRIEGTYPTIGIGEYEWTTRNLKLKYDANQDRSWANHSLDFVEGKLGTANFTSGATNEQKIRAFEELYGSWIIAIEGALSYREPENCKFTRKDVNYNSQEVAFGLPDQNAILQMIGQMPQSEGSQLYLNLHDFILGYPEKPIDFIQDMSKLPGEHEKNSKNISGLSVTLLGERGGAQNNPHDLWNSGFRWFLNEGWYAKFGSDFTYFPHFNWDNPKFASVRYTRMLTDEELGYKLYVDNCNDAVVMYPIGKKTKLTELPRGLERGIALRYANRTEMKIFRKWSEICAESDRIRATIAETSARPELPESPCEDPNNPDPDTYEKGKKGEILFDWDGNASEHAGLDAIDWRTSEMSTGSRGYADFTTQEVDEYWWTTTSMPASYSKEPSLGLTASDIEKYGNIKDVDNYHFNKLLGNYMYTQEGVRPFISSLFHNESLANFWQIPEVNPNEIIVSKEADLADLPDVISGNPGNPYFNMSFPEKDKFLHLLQGGRIVKKLVFHGAGTGTVELRIIHGDGELLQETFNFVDGKNTIEVDWILQDKVTDFVFSVKSGAIRANKSKIQPELGKIWYRWDRWNDGQNQDWSLGLGIYLEKINTVQILRSSLQVNYREVTVAKEANIEDLPDVIAGNSGNPYFNMGFAEREKFLHLLQGGKTLKRLIFYGAEAGTVYVRVIHGNNEIREERFNFVDGKNILELNWQLFDNVTDFSFGLKSGSMRANKSKVQPELGKISYRWDRWTDSQNYDWSLGLGIYLEMIEKDETEDLEDVTGEWRLPLKEDFFQLLGQAPVEGNQGLHERLLDFIGASQNENALKFSFPSYNHKNYSGLGIHPLGYSEGEDEPIGFGSITSFHIGHWNSLKDGELKQEIVSIIDQGSEIEPGIVISEALDTQAGLVRFCKRKTDGEIGYKLFIDEMKDSIVVSKYTANDSPEMLRGNQVYNEQGNLVDIGSEGITIHSYKLKVNPLDSKLLYYRYAPVQNSSLGNLNVILFFDKDMNLLEIQDQKTNVNSENLVEGIMTIRDDAKYIIINSEYSYYSNLKISLSDDNASILNKKELPFGLERGIALRYMNREQGLVLTSWSEIKAEAEWIKSQIREKITNPEPEPEPDPGQVIADPSKEQNYILTRTYTEEDSTRWMTQVQYFDGLGRPNQTVQVGIVPGAGADLVSQQEYDSFGRESNVWLPAIIASNNGKYITDFNTLKNASIESNKDQKPYSLPVYESSPLNRIIEQYGPGSDWHPSSPSESGKSVKTTYLTNDNTVKDLTCDLFTVTGMNLDISLQKAGTYNNGELFVTKVTDEDGNVSYEFKDKLGQVVLTRTNKDIDTYYVYDDFGNLCYVLPPLVEGVNNIDILNLYAFQYKYDERNRCIWKKLPGAEPIYYIYDHADQLILSQDGEQRKDDKNEWTFSIPDAFERIVMTGICVNSTLKEGSKIEGVVRGKYSGNNTTYKGYEISGFTLSNVTLHTVNYYDNYQFKTDNKLDFDETKGAQYNKRFGSDEDFVKSKGLLTGSLAAVLDAKDEGTFLQSVLYYDDKGRLIQSQSTNHLGGKDAEYMEYNFIGAVTEKTNVHELVDGDAITEVYNYKYDQAGRLLTTHHSLDGHKKLIALNTYDDLGRLLTNQKGNQDNLMTTYEYNVRSWTTKISGPLFTQNLAYNLPISGITTTPQWGGNVSAMSWTVQGEAVRGYGFAYDELSRLKDAKYTGPGKYTAHYTYDKHGNIMSITRDGKNSGGEGAMDNLTMNYNGNQLIGVRDAISAVPVAGSAEFVNYGGANAAMTYNLNGALASDSHKGISTIKYNSLNLPVSMAIDNTAEGGMAKGTVSYAYSAGGVKLQTVHTEDKNLRNMPVMRTGTFATEGATVTTTDYIANKVYEQVNNGDRNLKRILIDGGYIQDGKYHYYLTDHLGNNRVVADAGGTIVQKTHYYPFGMAYADALGEEEQPYKYNGKELDTRLQLNTYDYSARYMDPAIGRFTSIDPLAEKYYSISPYAYVANNPINAIDPRGDSIWFTIDNDVITLHYTAKMINLSSDNLDMSDASKGITSMISKALKGASIKIDGKSYSLNTDIQISVVSSIDDVASSDHLFVMADNDYAGIYGITNEIGGKVVHLNASNFHNEGFWSKLLGVTNNTRSGAHEAGHTFGLEHPNTSDIGYSRTKDIMVQGGKGTKFLSGAVQAIYNNWNNSGALNKGVNSTTVSGKRMPYQGVKNGGETGTIGTLGFKYKRKK